MADAEIILDAADRRLLAAVQRDAGEPQARLAERVGLSASQCSRRLQRLRDEGAIRATVALLEPKRLGFGFSAVVTVNLRDHGVEPIDAFQRLVAAIPEIQLCVMLTGNADYLLRITAPDLDAFQRVLHDRLLRSSLIGRSESSVVLGTVKDTTALPLT
jgi:DNA-binding Lrp family transcriptional regulator